MYILFTYICIHTCTLVLHKISGVKDPPRAEEQLPKIYENRLSIHPWGIFKALLTEVSES